MENEHNYRTRSREVFREVFRMIIGASMKYASLLAGVYSVCKDEPDFAAATFAGFVYLSGELTQKGSIDETTHNNFSELEKILSEKIDSAKEE